LETKDERPQRAAPNKNNIKKKHLPKPQAIPTVVASPEPTVQTDTTKADS
jgi:hypothetical protein